MPSSLSVECRKTADTTNLFNAYMKPTNFARTPWQRGSGALGQCHSTFIALVAAVALWGVGNWKWSIASASVAAVLVVAGLLVDRRWLSRQGIPHGEAENFVTGTEKLGRDVLPVWSAHIENS